jgi:CelD/BcsL family acetyltransferase involved in cellulose biosynthesis
MPITQHTAMHHTTVTRITTTEQFQQCAASWNCLTRGVPLRSWEWLSTWWEYYGTGLELYTLAVHDDHGTLLGLLPLFREQSATRGRVLRLLGSGEVCSDYVSVLSTNEHEDLVIDAVADWLIEACGREADRWDLLELEGISTSDAVMGKLIGTLSESGCGIHRTPGLNCWRRSLAPTWDEFYQGFSKNRRKAIRRLQKSAIDNGRAVYKQVESPEQLDDAMDMFIDLHQKRRISLGEPGCFASATFEQFIRDVSTQLFATLQLQVAWIEIGNQPVAVEYNLLDADTIYAYQGGFDPDAIGDSPGHVLTVLSIRNAIECGRTSYDFLRGDEPYKANWKAEPQATVNLRISANRTVAHLRQGVWLAGATMKNWVKGGMTLAGMQ